jgi:hypothetical protein
MPLDKKAAQERLKNFDFSGLFTQELGWDWHTSTLSIPVSGLTFTLTAIAAKRGMPVYHCPCPASGAMPDYPARRKIEQLVAKSAYEHIIIFTDSAHTLQKWQWVKREIGKPAACREHTYHVQQSGEALLQKLIGITFTLAEEESLALPDVTRRVREAFDVERVTKRFYEQFRKEKDAFTKFIEGIPVDEDQHWYASVMLNRLMFIYFIQRKGFLNGEQDYLRTRLAQLKQEQGKDKFYGFYRHFLLRLFHEGLGQRPPRKADLDKLLGRIPYLNGGIFDVHTLEAENKYGSKIKILDKAFERIFDFFDAYHWHLDERPLRADNEINPAVLGFIFEKYVNQKQMGAYYTQEDITEYIGKSTIIPFLFDSARAKCKVAFEDGSSRGEEAHSRSAARESQSLVTSAATPTVWDSLKTDPDRYIYPAVRHGMDKPLPLEITEGIDTNEPNLIERRKGWNKSAPTEFALPTEIWREVVARRQRCEELRWKLVAGEVREINDFITLNLDLRQFAQDVIQNSEGPDLLMAFWQAIEKITILDPTGGSGAFLFAALNILEPLYEACLDRMEAFLAEWGEKGKKAHPNYHKKFTEVLARVDAHPNRRYFVLKSIIVNNLYAVDIMEEAVEICKLRLFLKLAAQVDPQPQKDNLGIETLPDIDFNIRAGNSLVGYATADEVRKCMTEFGSGQMRLGVEDELQSFTRFTDKLQIADAAFRSFRQQQTELGGGVTAQDKAELREKLRVLEAELIRYLAHDYDVKPGKTQLEEWLRLHRPFHWLIEFYGIVNNGGFDVIIGNPPYLEYSKVSDYRVRAYTTEDCANLYAFTVERSLALGQAHGRIGMIVPISVACSGALEPLRECMRQSSRLMWLSHYSNRPGQLFTGAQNRLTIFIASGRRPSQADTSTRYHRWDAKNGEREILFPLLRYQALRTGASLFHGLLPKVGRPESVSVMEKIKSSKTLKLVTSKIGGFKIYWVRVPGYFCQFLLEAPMARPENGGRARIRGEVNSITFEDTTTRNLIHAILNSSTYYQFFCIYTDTRHINPSDVIDFPLDLATFSTDTKTRLSTLSGRLARSFKENTTQWRKSGLLIDSINAKPSKPILDEIDTVLAQHYGFTADELDFILNYDIKYRLGREAEGEDE